MHQVGPLPSPNSIRIHFLWQGVKNIRIQAETNLESNAIHSHTTKNEIHVHFKR